MYELTTDFDEQVFMGRYLSSLNIGAFSTSLIFAHPQSAAGTEDTITVSIQGDVIFSVAGHEHFGRAEDPASLAAMVPLLMKEVRGVRRVGKSSLLINFGGNDHLTLAAEDSADFESYVIYIPGRDILVV